MCKHILEVKFPKNQLFSTSEPSWVWKGVISGFSPIRPTFGSWISKLGMQIEKVALTIFKYVIILAKTQLNRSPTCLSKKVQAGFWDQDLRKSYRFSYRAYKGAKPRFRRISIEINGKIRFRPLESRGRTARLQNASGSLRSCPKMISCEFGSNPSTLEVPKYKISQAELNAARMGLEESNAEKKPQGLYP